MERTINRGKYIIQVRHVVDETPDTSWLEQDFDPSFKQRLAAYKRGEFYMMGVTVSVRIENATNWAVPHEVGRASLWGIESDSDESYLTEVENDLISEALADTKATRKALNAARKAA